MQETFEDGSPQQAKDPVRHRSRRWLRVSAATVLPVATVSLGVVMVAGTNGVASASRPLAQATESEEPTASATATATATPTPTATATVTPTGAVSAGGGGTAGSHGGGSTMVLSLAGVGLLGTVGVVMVRRRRAMNEV